jgi:hypothetical protein
MLARRLMHRRGKARVAASAAPAARDHETLVGFRKLEKLVAGLVVVHNRPDRNFQQHAAAVAPGFVRTFAVTSALRGVLGIETEMHQRVVALAGLHDTSPPLPPSPPDGPPRGTTSPAGKPCSHCRRRPP